jgi:hypothetical protein
MSIKRSAALVIGLMLGVAASRACPESNLVVGTTALPVTVPPFVMLWAVASCLTALAAWLILRKGEGMRLARHVAICIAWVAIAVTPVSAQSQDLSRYRQFRLGMTLEAVTHEVGPTPEVRVIHRRPALIQELAWHPPRPLAKLPDDEAVREVLFTFYEGELCRMLIDYDRWRTEGLTTDDILVALAPQYGPATRPRMAIMASISKGSHLGDEILANWEDARFAHTLFRPTYLSSFGLVMTERRLDGLARRAIKDALRLDLHEAPERERDRARAQNEEARVKEVKARQTNKRTFRP